jgi:Tol biopolymer transport system component
MHTFAIATLLALLGLTAAPLRAMQSIERVSVDSTGQEGDDVSGDGGDSPDLLLVVGTQGCSISADGRFVAFYSVATNLVPGDTNGCGDVFVHDRSTGRTERASTDSAGQEVVAFSFAPALAADGRTVAFVSAGPLAPNDTNAEPDVYVKDLATGLTTLVSVTPSGTSGPHGSGGYYFHVGAPGPGFYRGALSISGRGRYLAFPSSEASLAPGSAPSAIQIYVHDRATGTNVRASVATNGTPCNVDAWSPVLSLDGRAVAFSTAAANLVAGDANQRADVFVRDLLLGTTELASVASNGLQADRDCVPTALSADGRIVLFHSRATVLVPGDTNAREDVFRRDLAQGATTRVSVGIGGSESDGDSQDATLSADGRRIAFWSRATNLGPGVSNPSGSVYLHDRRTHSTQLVDPGVGGAPADGASSAPVLSVDGAHVAFVSRATNLVAGDTNQKSDVFVSD